MRALVGLVIFASLTTSAFAQDMPRQSNKAYHNCSFEYRFSLPFPPNQPPIQSYPMRPKRKHQPWPVDFKLERIWVQTDVEADGSISALSMQWYQGGFSWPAITRAELDDIALQAVFEEKSKRGIPETVGNFDPEKLTIKISAYHRKKVKHHTVLTIGRPYDYTTPKLGGLASVQPWRQSSDIFVPWPHLRDFSKGTDWLSFEVSALTYRSKALYQDRLRGGRIFVALLPKLIDAFQEAERQAKALKPATAKECRLIRNPDWEISN